MGDLFDGYRLGGEGPLQHAFEEVLDASGAARPQYREVVSVVSQMSPDDVSALLGDWRERFSTRA